MTRDAGDGDEETGIGGDRVGATVHMRCKSIELLVHRSRERRAGRWTPPHSRSSEVDFSAPTGTRFGDSSSIADPASSASSAELEMSYA